MLIKKASLLEHKLLEMFIVRDFMANNKWLPIDPRRQAILDYQGNPVIQKRINEVVGSILKIIEDNNDGLPSEEN